MRIFFAAVLVVSITLLFLPDCRAYEEYAEETGQDCSICHVDPGGGSELTDVGLGYRLSLGEPAAAGQESSAAAGPSATARTIRFVMGFAHLFTAFFWFGTILYVHLVLKPAYASKGLPSGEVRVGLISIVVMALTGIVLTIYRVPSWEFFVTTRFGLLLSIKIGLFLFLVFSALFVVLFIGPRLRQKKPAPPARLGDMSRQQLAYFDGKDGRRALIGYNGRIYDVTDSRMWRAGTHMKRHNAGEDLTETLAQAPHGADPVVNMPDIGALVEQPRRTGRIEHRHVFYFMAYVNLVVVIAVIFIVALWRWW